MYNLAQRVANFVDCPGKTPYINQGLIAMWDAQWYDGQIYDYNENGGNGDHNSWEGIWYDCFGKKFGNFINGDLGTMTHVSGDTAKDCYIQVDLSNYVSCNIQSEGGVLMPKTIEIVEVDDNCVNTFNGAIFSFGPRGYYDDIKSVTRSTIVGYTAGSVTNRQIQCYQNGLQITSSLGKNNIRQKSIVNYSSINSIKPLGSELYVNGVGGYNTNRTTTSGLQSLDSTGKKYELLGLGGYKGYSAASPVSSSIIKRIHCIRFYSIPLNSKQIAYNYKIDQQRFYS